MNRLDEIRERWERATPGPAHEEWWMAARFAPTDIAYLLERVEALERLVERIGLEGHQGDCCDNHGGRWPAEGDYIHAADCPWARARALVGEGT